MMVELMRLIADRDGVGRWVLSFDEHGQRTFPDVHGAADRSTAIGLLYAKLSGPERYDRIQRSSVVSVRNLPAGGVTEVDGCAVRWRATFVQLLNGSGPWSPGAPERSPAS